MKALNDRVFADLRMSWHDLHEIPSSRFDGRPFQKYRRQARDVLAAEFDEGVNPAIKDPRLCRLLPLWQPVLAELAGRTVYAISLRNPLDVASSLKRRNEFELELGLMLWARYYLDAEAHTRGRLRMLVRYDQLIDEWQKPVSVIREGIGLPASEAADETRIADFLTGELQHHRSSDEETRAAIERMPLLVETYEVLSTWAAGKPETGSDYDRLDGARHQIETMNPLIADMFERNRIERKRRMLAKSQADEAIAALKSSAQSPQDLAAQRDFFENQFGELGRRFKKLIGEANERTERLEAEVKALSAQARERAVLEQSLKKAVELNEEAEAQIARLDQQYNEAVRETRQQVAEVRIRDDAINQAKEELAALRAKQKVITRKYRSTQEILDRKRRQLTEARSALAKAESVVSRYRRSIPWKVYIGAANIFGQLRSIIGRIVGNSAKGRHERSLMLLAHSSLFDSDWYRENYLDVAESGVDPAEHYLTFGWMEGRDPGPGFSTSSYLKVNADVAAHGVNPLLHYIEYGHSEGRRAPEHAAPSRALSAPLEKFGPAAACVSFPSAGQGDGRWLRTSQLDKSRDNACTVGGIVLGYFADDRMQKCFGETIDGLFEFASRAARLTAIGQDYSKCVSLVDVWHAGQGLLRTRWRAESGKPIVVRTLQAYAGSISVIGESLIQSDLDVADASPAHPLLPLLYLLADTEGTILGWHAFHFPSLARGGLHYGELVTLGSASGAGTAPLDVLQVSSTLAEHLLELRAGKAMPLVSAIEVDLSGDDGSGPLFQSDFREWLSTVMGVPIAARGNRPDGEAAFLTEALGDKPDRMRNSDGATLVLPGDMYPSISALVAPFRQSPDGSVPPIPFLAVGPEPSQPATLLKTNVEGLQTSEEFRPAFPRIEVAGTGSPDLSELPIVALRVFSSRALTDSELLVPVAAPQLSVDETDVAVSWLVRPAAWNETDLLEALESIAAQVGAGPATIVCIGPIPAAIEKIAARLFSGRIRVFASKEQAIESIDTPLAGYLGPGVILHDVRTTGLLAQALRDPKTTTASPVMVSVDRRGKEWLVSPTDAGLVTQADGSDIGIPGSAAVAKFLWRSSWPVLAPPRDLWLSRTATIQSWRSADSSEGRHLCIALVSASYRGHRPDTEPPISVPRVAPETGLSVESVVG